MDEFSPVSADQYNRGRRVFDGLTGFLHGLAGAAGGVGSIVGAGTDIRDDLTASSALAAAADLDRREREQDLLLDAAGFERGDNLKLYAVAGGVVLLAIVLLR